MDDRGRKMNRAEQKNLKEGFKNLGLGSHVCSIYSSKEEQLSQIESFVEHGLKKNEKVLYVYDERTKKEIIERFKSAGIDIENRLETGQFEFLSRNESYLKDGHFDPEIMFELISEAKEKALDEGYDSLRGVGEMTWFFKESPSVGKLMEYESKLNEFLQGKKITILCQYNEDKFSSENLIDVIHTHPKVAINNSLLENHYYIPAEVFSARIKGEVDKDYYEKIKNNLTDGADFMRTNEKATKSDETLQSLLQTLDKLEKTGP